MVLYWNINSNYVDQSLEWSLYITSMSRPISALFTGAKNSINSRVRQAWKGSNHKQKKTESSSHEQNIQNGKDGEKCTDSAPKLPFLLHTSGACPLTSEGRALQESRASLWKNPFFLVEWGLLPKKMFLLMYSFMHTRNQNHVYQ